MARKFFYICAGMFLLALSYHFGASTATAQAGASKWSAAFSQRTGSALIGRTICGISTGTGTGIPFSLPPIPGSSPVGAYDAYGPEAGAIAVLEDGSVYELFPGGGLSTWRLWGTVCSGPTPTMRSSWGQLKSRYAPSRETAKPGASN